MMRKNPAPLGTRDREPGTDLYATLGARPRSERMNDERSASPTICHLFLVFSRYHYRCIIMRFSGGSYSYRRNASRTISSDTSVNVRTGRRDGRIRPGPGAFSAVCMYYAYNSVVAGRRHKNAARVVHGGIGKTLIPVIPPKPRAKRDRKCGGLEFYQGSTY